MIQILSKILQSINKLAYHIFQDQEMEKFTIKDGFLCSKSIFSDCVLIKKSSTSLNLIFSWILWRGFLSHKTLTRKWEIEISYFKIWHFSSQLRLGLFTFGIVFFDNPDELPDIICQDLGFLHGEEVAAFGEVVVRRDVVELCGQHGAGHQEQLMLGIRHTHGHMLDRDSEKRYKLSLF